jgi:uncharacterized protein (DUF1800 family)
MPFTNATVAQQVVTPPPAQDGKLDAEWAWSPYRPDAQHPWNLRLAGHLLRRSSFGASWQQLQAAVQDGPQAAIDRIVRPDADVAAFDDALDQYASAAGRSGNIQSLRAWWLRRILETPFPLQEKMTLFWHSRLGISQDRVKSAALMANHIRILRDHA